MKKALLLCLGLLFSLPGCTPQYGMTFGEFLEGRHVIQNFGRKGDAQLVWRSGKLAVERGQYILKYDDKFNDAKIVYHFISGVNEYAVIGCNGASGYSNILVFLTPTNMFSYNLGDPSSMPFQSLEAGGHLYLYQQDSYMRKFRVWEIIGENLYGPDFRDNPPTAASLKKTPRKGKKSGSSSSSQKPAQKTEEMPIADLPDV